MRALVAIVFVAACGKPAPPAAPPPPPPPAAPAIPVHEIDLATVRGMGELYRFVRVVPFVEHGSTRGYKLYAPRDPELFGRLGLRAGDVVVKANGLSLGGDLMKSFSVRQVLRDTSRLELEVLRKGEKVAVHIQLTDGTIGDVFALRADEPLADQAALKQLVDRAYDDYELKQLAPNSFAYTSLARSRLYDAVAPFVRMRALLGKQLGDGLPLAAPWLGRLGIQPGDVLIEINGRAITSLDDLIEATMDYHHSPTRIELRVRRAGRPVSIVYEQRDVI